MTHTKRLLASLLALAACGGALQAQEAPRHEVSAAFQGLGLGSMPFRGPQQWNDQPGIAVGFSAGYTYWFSGCLGFHTGVRVSSMSHNHVISNLDVPFSASLPLSSLGLPGGSGLTTVNLRATATSVQERQSQTYIELPLMLAMRHNRLYANAGITLAKANSATAEYSYTDPECTILSLPDLGVTPTTPVPMTLASATSGSVDNSSMPKPFFVLLGAEAGYSIPVGEAIAITAGLYGRLAPVAHKTENAAVACPIQSDATYRLAQPSASTLAEKTGYYEVGLSLGINFGLTKSHKEYSENEENNSADLAAARQQAESDLAAAKAAREKAEKELAAAKTARENAEKELAAIQAARKNAENDMNAYRRQLAERDIRDTRQEAAQKSTKQAEPVRETAPVAAQGTAQENASRMVFNFDYNKTRPIYSDETAASLRALCSAMQNDASLRVVVIGHTDNVGTKRNNNRVGRRRANAVKKLMVDLGAPAENIAIVTRGESEPEESNRTEEGRAHNRRATVEME